MTNSSVKAIGHIGLLLLLFLSSACQATQLLNEWDNLGQIEKNIQAPVFADMVFNIEKYGAVPDGKTDCSNAINKAIEECSKRGGGKVVIPKGKYLTGPVYLKSNVNLHLTKGAELLFSTDPAKYLPAVFTRWEGVECMNYSALIYAFCQTNIAVTGEGLLDGQSANNNWWHWCGKADYGWENGKPSQKAARKILMDAAKNSVPVEQRIFGEGSYLRPNFIQFYNCENILLEGFEIKNSPMWFIHPVLSRNITIRNLTIEGLGPNNDGVDPESCKDVLIEKCYFNTGDDCIAIKSGRNEDGRRINVPSENIIVRDCKMREGHGGVVMGSEISGGVKNVYAERCEMDSPNLERAIRFKTNSVRGGSIENIFARDITVKQVSDAAVKVDFYYEEGDAGQFTPSMKNVRIINLTCEKSPYAIWIKAYDRSPVRELYMENCEFRNIQKANVLMNVSEPEFINVKVNGKLVEREAIEGIK